MLKDFLNQLTLFITEDRIVEIYFNLLPLFIYSQYLSFFQSYKISHFMFLNYGKLVIIKHNPYGFDILLLDDNRALVILPYH